VEVLRRRGKKALPLYAYRCTKCGHRFEKIQNFNAEPEKLCPQCGGAVERPLTAPALQFKGAGWYVNDYASKSSGPSSDSKSSETKPETKGETKSESKPAEKSGSGDSGSSASTSSTPAATPGPTTN
jgi:putative FmdB family regulatory protein